MVLPSKWLKTHGEDPSRFIGQLMVHEPPGGLPFGPPSLKRVSGKKARFSGRPVLFVKLYWEDRGLFHVYFLDQGRLYKLIYKTENFFKEWTLVSE